MLEASERMGDVAVLWCYGPDVERLEAVAARLLRGLPLRSGSRMVIRPGPPGTPEAVRPLA